MTASSVVFLPGYFVYLMAILVPGYGLGEILGRWTAEDSVVQRLGTSLGYGLAFDTVAIALRTLGFRLGPIALLGVGADYVYILILVGAGMFVVSLLRKKKFEPIASLTKSDVSVLGCAGFVGVVVWLYLVSYPIFPPFYNPDYIAIVEQPVRLIGGSLAAIPRLLLYGGATFQTAAAFVVVGAADLATAQTSFAILVILSPLLFYSVAFRMFKNRRAALAGTVIYALSGTVWAQMVYSDGFYPNFVGVLLELTLILAFLDIARKPGSRTGWVVYGVVLVAAYFSHYTAIALIGSLVVLPVIMFLLRAKDMRGVALASVALLVPALAGSIFFRRTLLIDLTISYKSGVAQPLTTPLSQVLLFAPSAAYLAFNFRNDVGFLAMTALLVVALYRGVKTKDMAIALPAVWFFGLLIASPQDPSAWRFTLEAIVPMTLLAGYGLSSLMPSPNVGKTKRLRTGDPYKFGVVVVSLLFLAPMIIPGWAATFAAPLAQSGGLIAQVQGQQAEAMNWIGQNVPVGSKLLSITDPTFLYSGLFVGRNTTFGFFYNETQAVSYANGNGYTYLIVTKYNVFYNLATPASSYALSNLPWFTYVSENGITLVYSNSDVKIFQVNSA